VCKKTSNSTQGFSLIEVLTALVLFTFLVIGTLLMTTVHINSNAYTQHHTKAVQLAESGLELLRRVDYTVQLAGFDGVEQGYGTIANYPDYRRSFAVNYGAEISTLTVSIRWRVLSAESNPVTLSTQRVAP
jgi:prepilin-type N-terminal cleavage/methylation domain-containing protein